MEALENKPSVEGDHDWIWRVVILVIVVLFIFGFYLLLAGNPFPNLFNRDGDGSGDSSGGSWLDGLGKGDKTDDPVIPAPPALPS